MNIIAWKIFFLLITRSKYCQSFTPFSLSVHHNGRVFYYDHTVTLKLSFANCEVTVFCIFCLQIFKLEPIFSILNTNIPPKTLAKLLCEYYSMEDFFFYWLPDLNIVSHLRHFLFQCIIMEEFFNTILQSHLNFLSQTVKLPSFAFFVYKFSS